MEKRAAYAASPEGLAQKAALGVGDIGGEGGCPEGQSLNPLSGKCVELGL